MILRSGLSVIEKVKCFGDDQASNRIVVALAAFDRGKHVKTRPPPGKFRTYRAEALYQLQKVRITRVPSVIESESCQHVLRARSPIHS